jgi:hypothetical protein
MPSIAAIIAGLVIYLLFFHPFLTYSQRNRVGSPVNKAFEILSRIASNVFSISAFG